MTKIKRFSIGLMVIVVAVGLLGATFQVSAAQQTAPTVDVLVTGLDTPWELAFAPDGEMRARYN
jgi:hypothetical protein